MTASAKEVIAAAIPIYNGCSRDAITDAILAALDAAGLVVVPREPTPAMVATAILAALDAAGYVVVPREPTEAMVATINTGDFPAASKRRAPSIYRAMIAAGEKP